MQQEILNVFRLPPEDFFDQVVQYETVTTSERSNKTGGIWKALHRKRSQLQAGDMRRAMTTI